MYVLSWRIFLLWKFDLSLIPQKLQQQNPEGFKICTYIVDLCLLILHKSKVNIVYKKMNIFPSYKHHMYLYIILSAIYRNIIWTW